MGWKWRWEVDERTIVELKCSMFGKETVYVNSCEIASKRSFKFKNTYDFKLHQYRGGKIQISSSGFRPDATLHVDDRLFIADHVGDDPVCPACEAKNKRNDGFCIECGAALPKADTIEREHKVKEAITTIRVMAGMFLGFGLVMFFIQRGHYDASIAKLAGLNPTDLYPQAFNGKTYLVGELHNLLQVEKYSVLGLNIFLALIMLGLSFWAKKAPLASLIVATSVYVAIIVLNAIVDPTTIAQGIIVKAIFIGMLVKGIKSSLELRPEHAAR